MSAPYLLPSRLTRLQCPSSRVILTLGIRRVTRVVRRKIQVEAPQAEANETGRAIRIVTSSEREETKVPFGAGNAR